MCRSVCLRLTESDEEVLDRHPFLSGELEFRLDQRGVQPLHTDGGNARNWQVVDYGTVMVHIFDREAREFYNLDKLYREPLAAADGAQTEV